MRWSRGQLGGHTQAWGFCVLWPLGGPRGSLPRQSVQLSSLWLWARPPPLPVGTLGGAPLASGAHVAPVSAQVAAALRRGGGGAGRVPPYSSGKAPPPSQPHTPAQGGRARLGPARRRHAGD